MKIRFHSLNEIHERPTSLVFIKVTSEAFHTNGAMLGNVVRIFEVVRLLHIRASFRHINREPGQRLTFFSFVEIRTVADFVQKKIS